MVASGDRPGGPGLGLDKQLKAPVSGSGHVFGQLRPLGLRKAEHAHQSGMLFTRSRAALPLSRPQR